MAKICIALERRPDYEAVVARRLADHQVFWLVDYSPQERHKALKNCDALLTSIMKNELTPEEKSLLSQVPFTQTLSAGADQFDFARLPHDAFICSNVGGWSEGMAEHALAMALSAFRRLGDQKAALMAGQFRREGWGLRLLKGKQVLIVGFGGIGKACCERFLREGCQVSALSRRKPDDKRLSASYELKDLHQALQEAHIVILTAPANRESKNMFDREAFEAMKTDGVFINLSRAALVNRDALLEKLRAHPTFQAGIDPWWEEDHHWDGSDPLVGLSNVTATAHNSPDSETAWPDALEFALDNLERFLAGEPVTGRVNFSDYEGK